MADDQLPDHGAITDPAASAAPDAAPGGGVFAAVAAAYGLGVFNDNFYKQAVALLAVLVARRPDLQGWAAFVFSLPFVFFAAPAGWCADRFAKVRVVRAAKVLEVLAMTAGAAGVIWLSWPLVMAMLFLMGLQSTLFSPALNGSIPEYYPPARVLGVNGVLKMVTTAMMLLGMAAAGVVLDLPGIAWGEVPVGRAAVGTAVLLVAGLGCLAAFLLPAGRPAADPAARFPWRGPADTWRTLLECRADNLLWRVLRQDVLVWSAAMAQTLFINQLAVENFGLGPRGATTLVMAELLGVAAGGGLAGWLGRRRDSLSWLAGAAALAAAGAAVVALSGYFAPLVETTVISPAGCEAGAEAIVREFPAGYLAGLGAALFMMGVGGGLLLVPMESFLQTRPPAARRGAVLSAANAFSFAGMMAAGGVLALLPYLGVGAAGGFAGVTLIFALLAAINRRRPLASTTKMHNA